MTTELTASWSRRVWRILRPVLLAYLLTLLAMMMMETWLVYPVPPVTAGDWNPVGLRYEEVWFKSADGTKLHGWFVSHKNPLRAILYCHGNAEHIAFNADLAAQLRDTLEASVFLFDYRGYGHSEGRPDESGCIADGRAAQLWLADRMGIRPNDVVVMGRSLGGAVAIALAADVGAAALILENTFTTACDTAAVSFPWFPVRWCMDNRYDSLSRIQRFGGPLHQCHSVEDEFVPLALGRRLFDAAPSRGKRWLQFDGLTHNSAWPLTYYTQLAEFLDGIKRADAVD